MGTGHGHFRISINPVTMCISGILCFPPQLQWSWGKISPMQRKSTSSSCGWKHWDWESVMSRMRGSGPKTVVLAEMPQMVVETASSLQRHQMTMSGVRCGLRTFCCRLEKCSFWNIITIKAAWGLCIYIWLYHIHCRTSAHHLGWGTLATLLSFMALASDLPWLHLLRKSSAMLLQDVVPEGAQRNRTAFCTNYQTCHHRLRSFVPRYLLLIRQTPHPMTWQCLENWKSQ